MRVNCGDALSIPDRHQHGAGAQRHRRYSMRRTPLTFIAPTLCNAETQRKEIVQKSPDPTPGTCPQERIVGNAGDTGMTSGSAATGAAARDQNEYSSEKCTRSSPLSTASVALNTWAQSRPAAKPGAARRRMPRPVLARS